MEISFVLIYFCLSVFLLLIYVIKRRNEYWKDRGIPHDPPSIFFGNLKDVGKKYHFFEPMREIYKKYKDTGPFVGFYFFLQPAAFIIDLDLVKSILVKDFTNFIDRGIFHNEDDDPLSGHLFSLDGNKWKKLRNKLTPTFTSGKMRFMYPTILDVGHRFGEVFKEAVQQNEDIQINEFLARFSTDVIGTCAFGIDCNSLKDPKAIFRSMGKRVFSDRRHTRLVEFFIQSFPKLARHLHMKITRDDISKFFIKVVNETVEYREKNQTRRNDFLDLLIDLKKTDEDDLNGLTMEEIAAQAFVFFLAGFETSSTTMAYALYELAINQNIQNKLRSHIQNVLNQHDNEFTYECMKDMSYLDQVIKETLRKYSIVSHLVRRAEADYQIPKSKYVIEKDTMVIIPVDAIHNDPEIYPNPNEFDPDRFLSNQIQNRHSCSWLSFGSGPRNCIGLRFGKMQAHIGLVTLLKNFRFSVCSKTPIPIEFAKMGTIIAPKEGIFLKVETI